MKKQFKKLLKAVAVQLDPLHIRLHQWLASSRRPIPPLINRLRVGSTVGIGRFLEQGRRCSDPIRRAIAAYAPQPLDVLRVLDFGAGAGRTLQFFYDKCGELFATDVDATAVEWLAKSYPNLKASENASAPPLSFDQDSFDVVYSVSVWTHLPADLQESWLREIHRILKPGGLALLTTLGMQGIAKLRKPNPKEATPAKLLAAGSLYFEYQDLRERQDRYVGITDSYGLAYHSKEYISKCWATGYRVLDIEEGVIDELQDLVILKKL